MSKSKKTLEPIEFCCIFKQAWLQPYKAPCIVESGSYAITTVKSPYDFLTFFPEFRKKESDGQTYKTKITTGL